MLSHICFICAKVPYMQTKGKTPLMCVKVDVNVPLSRNVKDRRSRAFVSPLMRISWAAMCENCALCHKSTKIGMKYQINIISNSRYGAIVKSYALHI